ncbi:2-aminoethylphosphonate--pyruvate transaminase [Stappia sp. F7233]|uniref:2-aminoethylphosphonate--pyruvate transaminase n=1 Tax=Stappia albiluteola TaxID=2758565 RepID=A0A839AHY2_9HYPH|nr:2-aminoethylphosphonate--pyruvate transaminase [Stappia albiluteola]MBA5778745.1 2-aminoethylphosphonate--pyruvate transaminase [Stappia albiluteola]
MSAEEPILLTPGPLTTSMRVKQAMLRDWGSRDEAFVALNRHVIGQIARIAGCDESYAVVPLQGSGTYAVEAMIATLAPTDGRTLVLANGSYGRRIVEICRRLGRNHDVYEVPEDETHDMAELGRRLAEDPGIRAVAAVHCETTSGLLNPLQAISDVVVKAGRALLVDSMSGFGALPVDAGQLRFAALAASANKCLQGAPGVAFVICRKADLATSKGRSPSLVLDLEDQHRQMTTDGQWRYTPPTHVIAALGAAIDELVEEGGSEARLRRYTANCDTLITGMQELGFRPVLPRERQAPVIVSFFEPQDAWFDFTTFYDLLRQRGFAIYAGKMKQGGTFRIGTIGAIDPQTIAAFLVAAGDVVSEMRRGH